MDCSRFTLASGASALLFLFVACAGSQSGAEAQSSADDASTPSGTVTEPAKLSGAAVPFDEMSLKEQRDYMKDVVVPEMAKTFARFDSDEFAKFDCATCHGPGARSGNFKMPTKSLPALDAEEMDEHPEWTRFMKEEVTPQMAELLGEPVYDPETHSGFGCFDCHTRK